MMIVVVPDCCRRRNRIGGSEGGGGGGSSSSSSHPVRWEEGLVPDGVIDSRLDIGRRRRRWLIC